MAWCLANRWHGKSLVNFGGTGLLPVVVLGEGEGKGWAFLSGVVFHGGPQHGEEG